MTFDSNRFWSAFRRAGMLVDAVYQPASGAPVPVQVGFSQPDTLLMGDLVQVAQYQIEYVTDAMPNLQDGERIAIAGELYRVRGTPKKRTDGGFSIAELGKP